MRKALVSSVVLLLLMLVVFLSASALYAQTSDRTYSIQSQAKKVINFEWSATPHWTASNIATMEQNPFDGMVLAPGRRLKGLFDYTNWSGNANYLDTAALDSISFDAFTHNFIEVPPYNDLSPSVSYWNDTQWNQICTNLAAVATYINGNSRFKGIVFDPEVITETETGTNPWDWNVMKEGHTEAETKAKIRARASQVMTAMLNANPDLVINCPMMFEYLPAEWNLLDDWLNGWLDAIRTGPYPQALLVDGRKDAYYWADTEMFFNHHRWEDQIDSVNLTTFRNQVQVGRGVYADLCFDLYLWEGYDPPLTDEQESKRWQHCTYNSMATTDQYVRIFMDQLRWPGWERTAKWNTDETDEGTDITSVTWPPTDQTRFHGDAHTRLANVRSWYNSSTRLGFDVIGTDYWNTTESIDSAITASITAPSNGASFSSSDTITVTATGSGGTITKMEFYQNAQKIGEDTSSPYSIDLSFKEVGDHTLFARAHTSNKHGSSQPVLIHITSGGGGGGPTFVAAGTVASGTGVITPALPSGIQSNDILLLFLETANQAISISNQNGGTWTEVTNSPQGTGTAGGTGATRLTAFWSRYNGTQGAPTTSDSGNHQLGRIIAVRGCATSGNPWDVTAGGVEATSDTSGSIPGATTTVADTLVLAAIATSLPDASGTANFSAWTNGNLANLNERTDNTVTAGNGGGLGIATGGKATAGAYGNTAVTCATAATKGMMSIALKPAGGPAAPVADFSGNPTSGPAPLTVYFTDLSSGSPTSWSWTFGDGGSSQAQHPSHQYTAANQYTVSLTATNQYGQDSETKTNYITVTSGPTTLLSENFDASSSPPSGWTDTYGNCHFVTPVGAPHLSTPPNSAHSGTRTFTGYQSGGSAQSNPGQETSSNVTLVTSSINCTGKSIVTLKFWSWIINYPQYVGDQMKVEVSGNGGSSWSTVWQLPTGSGTHETAWTQHSFDISSVAANQPNVKIRWVTTVTDNDCYCPGWVVDDVTVTGE